MKIISENTIFTNDEEYAEFINDANKVRSAFWVNNLGFLALKTVKPSHFLVLKNFKNLKSARIANINKDDNDMAVSLKAAFDKGYLKLNFVNDYTKLLYILKTRPNVDLDEDVLRSLFGKINLALIMPDVRLRGHVKSWLEGEVKLAELIAPFYQYSRLNKTNVGFQSVAKMTGAYNEDFTSDDATDIIDNPQGSAQTAVVDTKVVVEPIAVPASPVAPVAPVLSVPLPKALDVEVIVKAPVADTSKIVNGDVVTKEAKKRKKTAADVKVTNKVAIAKYDDDKYRAYVDTVTQYLNKTDKWQTDYYPNDNIFAYAVLTSIYSNDVKQHYINIFGDLRKAKKFVKKGISQLVRDLSFGRHYDYYEISKKVGAGSGAAVLTPVSVNMDEIGKEYLGNEARYYNFDSVNNSILSHFGEDYIKELKSKSISPTIKDVLDAISITADTLYNESEYAKLASTEYNNTPDKIFYGYSPYGMYDITRIEADEKRFSKSPLKFYNFTKDMIDSDNTREELTNYLTIYLKYLPEMFSDKYKDRLIARFRSLILSGFDEYKQGTWNAFIDFLIDFSKSSIFDSFSDVKFDQSWIDLSKVFEKLDSSSDAGKKLLGLIASGFFEKIDTLVHIPEDLKTSDDSLIEFKNYIKSDFNRTYSGAYTVSDFYERFFPNKKTEDNIYKKKYIELKDIKSIVEPLGVEIDAFIDNLMQEIVDGMETGTRYVGMLSYPYEFFESFIDKVYKKGIRNATLNYYEYDSETSKLLKEYYLKHDDRRKEEILNIIRMPKNTNVSFSGSSDVNILKLFGYSITTLYGDIYQMEFGTSPLFDSYKKYLRTNYNVEKTNEWYLASLNDSETQFVIDAITNDRITIEVLNSLFTEYNFKTPYENLSVATRKNFARIYGAVAAKLAVSSDNILKRINSVANKYPEALKVILEEYNKIANNGVLSVVESLYSFFASPADISDEALDKMKENKENTINAFLANISDIMKSAGITVGYGSSYGNPLSEYRKFFEVYGSLRDMLETNKQENTKLSYGIILAILKSVGYSKFNYGTEDLAKADNWKEFSKIAIEESIPYYVRTNIGSRRRNANDKLGEILITYDKEAFDIYLPYLTKIMKEENIKMTPKVAKTMGLGRVFVDAYMDDNSTDEEKKKRFENYTEILFGDETVTPAHLNSIIGEMIGASAAKSVVNSSKNILPIYASISGSSFSKILKLNNFDIGDISSEKITAKGIKTKGVYTAMIEAAESASVDNLPELAVKKLDMSTDELNIITKAFGASKFNGMHGNTGMQVLDVYDVNLRPKELVDFIANNPNAKVEREMYHGTGSIAANMILRFGFALVKGGIDGIAVTGKMLGNGIYLSPVVEKSMQYISDNGYSRRVGDIGYIFECNLYTTERGQTKRAGYGGDNIKSPEIVVFDGRRQIEIVRAYRVKLITKKMMRENGTLK